MLNKNINQQIQQQQQKNNKLLGVYYEQYDENDLPQQLDWRDKNAVNKVKNQQQCGSCWSFSAIAVLETQNYLTNNELLDLSEQQLVDCDPQSNGCNGGLQLYAFEYLQKHPVQLENNYPYKAQDQQCNENNKGNIYVDQIQQIKPYSINDLKYALTQGVVAVTIQADQLVFQNYYSGILNSKECYKGQLDHAVSAVGYGYDQESQQEYLIVRNSWGTQYGLDGYVKIALNDDNICGILMNNLYATVKKYNDIDQQLFLY